MNSRDTEEISELVIKYFVEAKWDEWVSLFCEDGSFINPLFEKPVVGKLSILKLVKNWEPPELRIRWKMVEGSRIVSAWEQKIEDDTWMSGVSIIELDSRGYIKSYEGIFNAELLR